MPNYFLDEQLGKISLAGFAALAYICRRTLGFNQTVAKIPLNQFLKGLIAPDGTQRDNGAGISNRNALIAALKELREKGLIDYKTVRGLETTYSVILPVSADLILAEEKASIGSDTKQVSEVILAQKRVLPSGMAKHFSRKKELERKKDKRSITAPIDFSKFEPGGKYEKMVK